eukprot:TRINITY_DN1621_c0_g1_i12.p1 TRINITY_DN1621_c0_g1~~TRINITY_DN1621_c0_g1_i12.p1  ORF type:complete len:500 (+),score=42.56 TRINITY_DN1621_c0_g1_i12:429-1928(+)
MYTSPSTNFYTEPPSKTAKTAQSYDLTKSTIDEPTYLIDCKNYCFFHVYESIKKEGIGNMKVYKVWRWKNGQETPCIFKNKIPTFIDKIDKENPEPFNVMTQNMAVLNSLNNETIIERLEINELPIKAKRKFFKEEAKNEIEENIVKTLSSTDLHPKLLEYGNCYVLSERFVAENRDLLYACANYNMLKGLEINSDMQIMPQESPYQELLIKYEASEEKKCIKYMTTEYINAYTLNELIFAKGAFLRTVVRYIFRELVQKLAIIHYMKIAHLNIKLDHVLGDPQGEFHFIGYGISRKVNESREVSGGTPPYCPGEIYNQSFRSLFASDIFSMGVLVFALIHCRFPFAEALQNQPLYSSLTRKEYPDFWQAHRDYAESKANSSLDHDPELYDLLSHMFEYEPELRPSLSEIIAHPWYNMPVARKEEVQDEIRKRTLTYYNWYINKQSMNLQKPTEDVTAKKSTRTSTGRQRTKGIANRYNLLHQSLLKALQVINWSNHNN